MVGSLDLGFRDFATLVSSHERGRHTAGRAVNPKTSDNCRSQRSWSVNPHAPDRKNKASRRTNGRAGATGLSVSAAAGIITVVAEPLAGAVDLETVFGPLEARVLDALWGFGGPATVRDLQPRFASSAYTTLMTTLDRLHRKGVLDREKMGRAYAYRHRWSREEFVARVAGEKLGALIAPDAALQPLVSFFVDAVTRRDAEVLDELERIIVRRRREERP